MSLSLLFQRIATETLGAFKTHSLDVSQIMTKGYGFGELHHDTEIRMDEILAETILRCFESDERFRMLTIEGRSTIVRENAIGDLWATIDPLDGSLNFHKRHGSIGLPMSACVTIFDKYENAYFKDIIGAMVVDLRSGDLWTATLEASERFVTRLNGKQCFTDQQTQNVDLTQMIGIAEFYYPQNRERVVKAFADEKGWLRNPGSAAYEMALVSSGSVAFYLCETQKQHELGAAYALVKGAGGIVSDLDGNSLDHVPYTFNTQTPVLLAANEHLQQDLLKRWHKR